jgi:subtilase family serine protease
MDLRFFLRSSKLATIAFAVLFAVCVSAFSVYGQNTLERRRLITQPVDEHTLVKLTGNTRPEARPENDKGPVADDLQFVHLYLQMKRAPEVQAAMDALVDKLHDRTAPEYHRWLTAEEIGTRFGPAEEDIETVKAWLESHGFSVNVVYRANGVLDFSGPASAIREAFHTEIHHLNINGEAHIANMSDPQIPAALAPAIHGIVSLHDFRPHRMVRPRPQYTFTNSAGPVQAVVPDDLYTIYNFSPVLAAGITGAGQTIVTIEDSDLYTADDWYKFRSTFGLTKRFPDGSLKQIHPQPTGSSNAVGSCLDPGANGDDGEATLDVEWASAAAPNAAIILASCADVFPGDSYVTTGWGGFIALQNLLTAPGRPPGIISNSYGTSEPYSLQSGNVYTSGLYEIAVLQGISVFVSAGDEGADFSDYLTPAYVGISVNGFASTPYNVAVGGTDFADTYLNEVSTYWSAKNGKYYQSALSYVPETPWNDSCASQLLNSFYGYPAPYGTNSFCSSAVGGQPYYTEIFAGSGGPSGCAFGTPSITIPTGTTVQAADYAVVSGTCQGYPKPIYQQFVAGNPKDGVRDLPDVSMFAADGVWGHFYVACYSDPTYGTPCVGAPSNWSGGGGTSFSSPVMAGVQALINQATGSYQGNPNYVLYALGTQQYNLGGNSGCDSTLGNQSSPHCIFHDVTLGDNAVDCTFLIDGGVNYGTFNCYLPSGTYGVLSLSNTSYEPAYPATPAWDFATGLGSVNAYNLVKNWPGSNLQ